MEQTKYFIFILLGGLAIQGAVSYIRVCYYTNWSQFVPTYRFTPARIPSQLCTHIIFAYADIRANNVTPTEFNDAEMYGRLNRLKRDRPSLQVILAVGGWAAGGDKFSRLVANENSMELFTDNLVTYLRRHNLDGVNIDWQYPTARDRGSEAADRQRYTTLLQTLQRGFDDEAEATGRTRLSLSAALETDLTEARSYYQIEELGRVLDFACLMAYDMHGEWDRTTGALHHSPLEPEIRTFIQGWIQAGFPADKIVLTFSGFGRSFTLTSEPEGNGLGHAVTGGGSAGAVSREIGLLDYGEICSNIARDGWTRVWMPERSVPIAYGNTTDGWQWVGYDDPQSLTEKAAFIRRQGLAGVGLWSLEHDDFNNLCQNGTWPLLRALARELPSNSTQGLPRSRFTTTTPTSSGTRNPKLATASTTPPAYNSTSTERTTTTTRPTTTTEGVILVLGNIDLDDLDIPDDNTNFDLAYSKGLAKDATSTSNMDGGQDDIDTGTSREYNQCKISENIGSALTCPATRGKPGSRATFYLLCYTGFFAIECRCLPGHFYNRCLQSCDVNANFRKCPLVH